MLCVGGRSEQLLRGQWSQFDKLFLVVSGDTGETLYLAPFLMRHRVSTLQKLGAFPPFCAHSTVVLPSICFSYPQLTREPWRHLACPA